MRENSRSKKISNDQELIQSDPISCPQNQKGNNQNVKSQEKNVISSLLYSYNTLDCLVLAFSKKTKNKTKKKQKKKTKKKTTTTKNEVRT